MNIKKFTCKVHNITTTRKGIRKHLGEYHARNRFNNLRDDGKGGVFKVEEFK